MGNDTITGYELWRDRHRVCVVTLASTNRKTGNMLQTWVLPRAFKPSRAVRLGRDRVVCGDCPLRAGVCNIFTGHAPDGVWEAWQAGKYPQRSPSYVIAHNPYRAVRIAAWGDPWFVPLGLWEALIFAPTVTNWTGYSHQWRRMGRAGSGVGDRWRYILQASTESRGGWRMAVARGWSPYGLVADQAELDFYVKHLGATSCPYFKSHGAVQCVRCGLCKGLSGKAPVGVAVVLTGKAGPRALGKAVSYA